MDTTELFYPDIQVILGQYCFTEGINVEVSSNKSSYFDWGKIKFTQQFAGKLTIPAKTKAVIKLGYNGVFDDVFEGYTTKPYNEAGGMNEIVVKDDMLLLENVKVTNTFIDATPQDIIGYCLHQAGVSNMKLSSKHFPVKKRFGVFAQNVIAVINEINTAWSASMGFYFSNGTFYWGEKPEQAKVYRFEYGANIITLNRSGSLWELETVSTPFIRHSHTIAVSHPQISGVFEVQKVVFTTNEAGFIRTYIYF